MNRKLTTLLILASILSLGIVLNQANRSHSSPTLSEASRSAPQQNTEEKLPSDSPLDNGAPLDQRAMSEAVSPTEVAAEVQAMEVPDWRIIEKERKQNLHRVPPTLLKWARTVGLEFERAKKDSRHAQEFMGRLEQCALDGTASVTVTTVCMSTARRLAKIHPSLQRDFESIQSQANQATQEIENYLQTPLPESKN